jgi:hypothetical protein
MYRVMRLAASLCMLRRGLLSPLVQSGLSVPRHACAGMVLELRSKVGWAGAQRGRGVTCAATRGEDFPRAAACVQNRRTGILCGHSACGNARAEWLPWLDAAPAGAREPTPDPGWDLGPKFGWLAEVHGFVVLTNRARVGAALHGAFERL